MADDFEFQVLYVGLLVMGAVILLGLISRLPLG